MDPDKAPKLDEIKLQASQDLIEILFQTDEFLGMLREGDAAHEDQLDRKQYVPPTKEEMLLIIEAFENYTFNYTPGEYLAHEFQVGSLKISPHILPFADQDGSYHMRITAKRIPLESAIRLNLSEFPFVICDENDLMIRPSCEPNSSLYFYGISKASSYRFDRIKE